LDKRIGLCSMCVFARVVTSARGSRFRLCRLSRTDPSFVRYPRLPVLECEGYQAVTQGSGADGDASRGEVMEKG